MLSFLVVNVVIESLMVNLLLSKTLHISRLHGMEIPVLSIAVKWDHN